MGALVDPIFFLLSKLKFTDGIKIAQKLEKISKKKIISKIEEIRFFSSGTDIFELLPIQMMQYSNLKKKHDKIYSNNFFN